jgi:hypothetical protein
VAHPRRAGRPFSTYPLAGRLRQLAIRSGQSRSTALFRLAADLPAVILARLLGIHVKVAATRRRASKASLDLAMLGHWLRFAPQAEICTRTKYSYRRSGRRRPGVARSRTQIARFGVVSGHHRGA